MPIEKRRLDDKTYELRNTDRDLPSSQGPTPITQAAMDAQDSIRSGERAAGMFEEMMQAERRSQVLEQHKVKGSEGGWQKAESVDDFLQSAKEATGEQKNFWRKQFGLFDKTLKKGGSLDAAVEGVQELLDTGALYMDDDGNVFTAVPGRGGPKRNDRLLDASRAWGDWYRDQLAYGEDVGPNGRASVEMDNTLRMNEAAQAKIAKQWRYDPASGGYSRD